tara:strand:+ start:543 stop:1490 length:948 start_codon:yes stop_codon:yes gene_type:complete
MSDFSSKSSPLAAWFSIAALSTVFVGAYFVLHALPDVECGLLHYIEIVNADGEIELCATNHAGFLDLSRLEYPIKAKLSSESAIAQGESSRVRLDLKTSGGMSIAPHELAVTHTEKMHVMLIDPSLEDYHHVHPEAVGLDGQYFFDFTPALAGSYKVFTEIVPLRSRRQAIALSELEVPGQSTAPKFERSMVSLVDGVLFELLNVPDILETGRDYRLQLSTTDPEGKAIDLEIVMGAKGHMVAFDSVGMGFAHMHPVGSVASVRTAGLGGGGGFDSIDQDLAFMFNVPNPGWYRLFAQIQVKGKAVFGRFDLRVE